MEQENCVIYRICKKTKIGFQGLARIDTDNPMEPLLFGALISAVDPVATLSIMGSPELNCDPLLYR